MKDINKTIQGLATQMTSEAKSVFATANQAVQNIIGSVQGIVSAGASQAGFSQTELNAKNAAAVNAGAAEARNLEGAAASSVAAIAGGNTVMPAGTTSQIVADAKIKAAEDTANAENQITQQNYERGNQNYWKAVGTEESAPGVLGVANSFNESAMSGEKQAETSQQGIDTASNWWKNDIMKAGTAALGFATGGVGNFLSDSDNPLLSSIGDAMTAPKKG